MNTVKLTFAALLVTASLAASGTMAATVDYDFEDDYAIEEEVECEFDAERGGYVCETADSPGSLSDLGTGSRKKLKLPPIAVFF